MVRRQKATLVVTFLLLFCSCSRPSRLVVKQEGRRITIDTALLGEYPTDIAALKLIDAQKRQVIWSIEGADNPQLGTLRLQIGTNSPEASDVRHGQYHALIPSSGSFVILPNHRYVVEIWGRRKNEFSMRQRDFVTREPIDPAKRY